MWRIRQANINDLDELVQLRIDLMREVGSLKEGVDEAALETATRRYFVEKLPKGGFLAWVAEADGRVVGISGLILFDRPPTADNLSGLEGYVLNMYTMPEWRGKGIGTALLNEIIKFAKTTDARRLRLHATPAGRPVYEKALFIPLSATRSSSALTAMELAW